MVTDTTADSTTTTGETGGGDSQFVLTGFTFGDVATVTITNVGSGAGSLAGHFLCQRPSYASLSDTELAAGESITLTVGEDVDLRSPHPKWRRGGPLHVFELRQRRRDHQLRRAGLRRPWPQQRCR